jgi:hypothetical protein
MAADPWSQFVEKPAANDPWGQFVPQAPASTAAAAPPSAPQASPAIAQPQSMPGILNRPAGQSVGDYLAQLYQMDKPGLGQVGQFGLDYARVAGNTLLGYDRIAAGFQAPHGFQQTPSGQWQSANDPTAEAAAFASERAKTAAAQARLGLPATIAATLTGGGPLGEVAAGVRASPYLSKLPGWLASRVAGGTAGTGSAAVGAANRGEDATWPTLIAGALGTLVGAPTGGAGGAVARSVEEAQNAESAAYFPTHSMNFPMHQISDAYYDAAKALTKDQQAGLSSGFNSQIAKHIEENSKTFTTSASEIDGFQRGVNEAARTNADRVFAKGINDNLNNVLSNTKPVTPSGDPSPVFATGDAAKQLAKAKLLASRRMNAEQIAEVRRVGGLEGGPGVGDVGSSWAYDALKANPQFYADPAVNAAMRKVAGAGSWIPPSYLFKHALAYPVAGALVGGGHGLATGDDPWTRAGEEALIGTGVGLTAGYGLPFLRNRLVGGALTQAAPTLTAGAPFAPATPFADAMKRVIYGFGAGGVRPSNR